MKSCWGYKGFRSGSYEMEIKCKWNIYLELYIYANEFINLFIIVTKWEWLHLEVLDKTFDN